MAPSGSSRTQVPHRCRHGHGALHRLPDPGRAALGPDDLDGRLYADPCAHTLSYGASGPISATNSGGAGKLNGQVRVLMPTEIVGKTMEYRDIEAKVTASADESGFSRWDTVEVGLDLLPPERWLSAVLLVDPGDGHRIVFHPDGPDGLFFI